ncbi:alpha/beta hydrolase [Demequina sp. SO4-18]|uniref:alpha/beta hydrolase n=1 Tax=Demequina sp. SO4-18 TaxID=3401026 RepID=UPI003B5ADB3E
MAGSRSTHRVKTAVALVAVVVVGLGVAVWFGQRALMYHPDTTPVASAGDVLTGGRDVVLSTADGLALDAWYVPPVEGCDASVLVAPGNAGNRAGRVALAEAVTDSGFGVMLIDYRGYGGNPGTPSESGLALDIRAARAALLEQGQAEDRIIYLGESLGTGVVSELAVDHPPAALVLRSPMTSFGAVAQDLYGVPLGGLLRDQYPVIDHVRQITVPVAVVSGTSDALVPPAQSEAVADAARHAGAEVVEVSVPGAGHNDPSLTRGPALIGALADASRLAGIRSCQ